MAGARWLRVYRLRISGDTAGDVDCHLDGMFFWLITVAKIAGKHMHDHVIICDIMRDHACVLAGCDAIVCHMMSFVSV